MLSIGSGGRIRRVYSGALVLLCGAAMVSCVAESSDRIVDPAE
jgi:hypothetical protein